VSLRSSSSVDDQLHIVLVHSKLVGDLSLSEFTRRPHFLNLPHVNVWVFGIVMILALSIASASFANTIVNVVPWSAGKQMSRVDASGIVTTMAHKKPIGNFRHVLFIAEPVNHSPSAADPDLTVTVGIHTTGPVPARVCFMNSVPKSGPERLFEVLIFHCNHPSMQLRSYHAQSLLGMIV